MTVRPYPQSIVDILAAGGDAPVFEHGTRTVTAARMLSLVRRVSAGLRAAGIGPGHGLAMVLGVSAEAFAAMIAAQVVGARVAGVRPGLTPDQLRHLLAQDIDTIVMDASTDTETLRSATGTRKVIGLEALTATGDDGGELELSGRPDDIARIVYTSGSTGLPKGCAQSYAALGRHWASVPDRWPPAIRELAGRLGRYLIFGSLSSLVMMEYGTLTLAAGGTMVVAEPPAFPGAFARYRATASVITVPRLYSMVRAQQTDPVDLSTLQALMVSGSPLSPDRLAEALSVLGPVIFQGYGQTETGMIAMATPADMASAAGRASVGRPPSIVDVEIRNPDGAKLPSGVDGEIYVRTPQQASAYWGDPAGSADVFVDGWVRTHDLGHLDADGYLHLVGRARDVVMVNANTYYLGPVERVLASHPDVADAYAVAAPDEETGEAVHAFVVPAAGQTPDTDELRSLIRARLGDACVPRTVTFIDGPPIAPSGKPDKRILAASLG